MFIIFKIKYLDIQHTRESVEWLSKSVFIFFYLLYSCNKHLWNLYFVSELLTIKLLIRYFPAVIKTLNS